MPKTVLAIFVILFFHLDVYGQNHRWKTIFDKKVILAENTEDYKHYTVTHEHLSTVSGIHHIYLQQLWQGVSVVDGVLSLHIDKQGNLIAFHDQFIKSFSDKVRNPSHQISPQNAVQKVWSHFGIEQDAELKMITQSSDISIKTEFESTNLTHGNVFAEKKYLLDSTNQIRLSWEVKFEMADGSKNLMVYVDVENTNILRIHNLTLECEFVPEGYAEKKQPFLPVKQKLINEENVYHVYPLTIESPTHGSRSLVANPMDINASPFGWHDTNGIPGAEFTETKGNNVEAREDIDGNNNTLGEMADGGTSLIFDFPVDFMQPPVVSQDAAITNLFYWNNVIHDIFYQYGFNEVSGNFQTNNYGNGGLQNDHVRADAMDGSGTNNANFSTPVDGNPPRMQMFLWTGPSVLSVNSPQNIAGNYTFSRASFGPSSFSVTQDIVLVNDGSGSPSLGCNTLVNGSELTGKIALVDRGSCEFGTKCLNAQNAGAIAVIVCNNDAGAPFSMGPGVNGNNVTIPSVMMRKADCDSIKVYLGQGVNVSIMTGIATDGDYDNGIVSHEYGHGISIRLTGGAGNSSCLSNTEQMGEGWSDWFGLMLTMDVDDTESRARGIGTYALNQPATGPGIRPFRYSTDMTINPQTYSSIVTAAIPHGIGSVWCTMLWEFTWALIREYGYDEDLYNGQGGNNKALFLVTEGLKLQPCSHGFIDGRNAILLADSILFGGENSCLIWKAFAKRGLGYSSGQGSSASRTDGVQAFDMPPFCCKHVSNVSNTGNGSLRTAIECAENGDTITFLNFIKNDTIELENNGLLINKDLTIVHPESWHLGIKSSGNFPVFEVQSESGFQNLNIIGGTGSGTRGILNNGILTLKNLSLKDREVNNSGGEVILNQGQIILDGEIDLHKD